MFATNKQRFQAYDTINVALQKCTMHMQPFRIIDMHF